MAGAAAAARRCTEPARNVSSTDTALEVLRARGDSGIDMESSQRRKSSSPQSLFNVLWVY